MAVFQVQHWPDGKWDGKDYKHVEAATAKDAAEKECGCSLSERGGRHQIRAQVRSLDDFRAAPMIFYAQT
jgi:hypothetical protein